MRFVVQAHAARSMHYDFRLQIGDVLVSWAVPKGPSLDPKDRRLAVLTEDHPLKYADFEGIIPKGQYGGGSVIVWDEGTWQPEGDPREAFEKGKLQFTLQGSKLRGRFHLNRTRSRGGGTDQDHGSSWLLIKGRDEAARDGEESIVTRLPQSVVSGRTLDEVVRAPEAVWRSHQGERQDRAKRPDPSACLGARQAPFPTQFKPQLATLVSEVPAGEGYLHEAKLDGYRLLAEVRPARSTHKQNRSDAEKAKPESAVTAESEVKLWTRGNKEWSHRLASLSDELKKLSLGEAVLDGEVVVFDEQGLSNFQLLQNALGTKGGRKSAPTQLVYVVFDLLYLDGYDLTKVPLEERKAILSDLLESSGADAKFLRFSDHVVGQGPTFFDQACKLGMEGIISKRVDAPYRQQRSQGWLKCKCIKRQEVVIGGYTEPSGSRSGLGALLVGMHDQGGKFRYAGKVGTGFNEKSLADLSSRLAKLTRKTTPFEDPPRGAAAKGVHWVSPQLLVEVTFSEVTQGGKLRHPSFQGLREDKLAKHIGLEQPVDLSALTPTPGDAPALPLTLSHPDRILFPDQNVTKQELAEYYMRVTEWMMPFVADRLLTLVRCPAGQAKPCFYQKHANEGLPDAIISHTQKDEKEQYVYVRDAAGLVGLVQVAVLEIHTWGSKIDRLDHPDMLVFDLDPDPDLDWSRIVEGALDVRDELLNLGLESFVKTTGGKGLHVTVPVQRTLEFDEAKAFCRAVAEKMARDKPRRYVATMAKRKRTGKIFIDYLRNANGSTFVAPFSTRARVGAPVATPVAWEELGQDVRGLFTVRTVPERLASQTSDPWRGFFDLKQSVTKKAKRALGLL